jgi:hypothetical protein
MTSPVAPGYQAEVDTLTPEAWCREVAAFKDANLYQVWQHRASPDPAAVSRMVVRRAGNITALAEVRLLRVPLVPFIRLGVAYALWGPLFKRNDDIDLDDFKHAIRAMRNEYAIRRGMVLRISPRLYREADQDALSILADEGFLPVSHGRSSHSLVMDLAPDVDQIRRELDKKWRNCLSKAERAGLKVTSGTGVDMFDGFIEVYNRMLHRKQFVPSADIEKHRRLQQELPGPMKMQVVLASGDEGPCAGAIYSALGDTAVYLFGATDDSGMRTSASYLVQWRVITELKELGVARYDLNGVDPKGNPGPYHFKRGLAGSRAMEVSFAGQFQTTSGPLANRSFLMADRLRHQLSSLRSLRPVGAGTSVR